jgi:hypothetical protein
MDFFAKVTKPSKGTQEIVKPETVKWNKGLKGCHSEETIAKIKFALSQRDNTVYSRKKTASERKKIGAAKSKALMTPNGLFPSCVSVAKTAGVCTDTVRKWIRLYPNDYYYVA